jgi:hypothetical protein
MLIAVEPPRGVTKSIASETGSVFEEMKSLHIIVSVLLALPHPRAGQPMASGTIIVIAKTKNRVIIAADSRTETTVNGTVIQGIDDSSCKIAALSGDVVFTAAGLVSDGKHSWTAVSEAIAAIANTPHGNRISAAESDLVLANWAEAMKQNFREFSNEQLSAYAHADNGHLTTGLLAGVEKTGGAWIHAMMLNYANGFLSPQDYVLNSDDPPTAYTSVGKYDIFHEFEGEKKSSRAIAERAAWEHTGLLGTTFDEFKARRLVELTIMYHPDKLQVGGPVDEIELDANGVRWVQVKKNCERDIATGK